jgi:hypothetical protein
MLLGDFHETLFKLFLRFLSNTQKKWEKHQQQRQISKRRAWVKKNFKHENWERHFDVAEKEKKNKNLLLSAVPQLLHQNFFVSIEKLNKNLCNKNHKKQRESSLIKFKLHTH